MSTLTLDELDARRSFDRDAVERAAQRMRQQVRAARLQELRREQAMTQVELAHVLSVSQHRVSQIERGDIDKAQLDTLRRYIEALGGRLLVEAEFGEARYLIV